MLVIAAKANLTELPHTFPGGEYGYHLHGGFTGYVTFHREGKMIKFFFKSTTIHRKGGGCNKKNEKKHPY